MKTTSQNNQVNLLREILSIIKFDGDEERFIDEFVQTSVIRSLDKYLLSKNDKDRVLTEIESGDNSFIRGIRSDVFENLYQAEVNKMLTDYLKFIESDLDDGQIEKIGILINKNRQAIQVSE